MSETKHSHPSPAYWKRAHRDWRFWTGVVLMLAAMYIYVRTEDLSWRPRGQGPPLSVPVGK